jgi:hypothetical protein
MICSHLLISFTDLTVIVPGMPGIFDLVRETRQRIYDYIMSEAGDKRLKVTLDQHNILRLHDDATRLNLICTNKTFGEEVPAYLLLEHIPFVLTDDQRTCRPIVIAFRRQPDPERFNQVRKLSIPFLTFRNLIDPAISRYPHNMQIDQSYLTGTTNAHFLPCVASHNPLQGDDLEPVQDKLRRNLDYTCHILYGMKNLEYLELGVDVLEFLICDGSGMNRPGSGNLGDIIQLVRNGRGLPREPSQISLVWSPASLKTKS